MTIGNTCIEPLLPGPAARPPGLEYATAVWSGMATIEAEVIDLRDALHNIDVATGIALDILGGWVGELRLGLVDFDYRRIIAGRRVALAGGVTPAAVIRGWRAVTGDDEGLLFEQPSEVFLVAEVSHVVDSAWLARASLTVRDMIGNGRALYGVVASPGAFRWGVTSFDAAGFSADFSG